MNSTVSFDALGRRFESCRGHHPQVTTYADHRASNHDTPIHHKPIRLRRAADLRRAAAIIAELIVMCLAAVAYGTLGGLVGEILDAHRYVNAASYWPAGWGVLGALCLAGWASSISRRWAVTQEVTR